VRDRVDGFVFLLYQVRKSSAGALIALGLTKTTFF
jgi:hypothetical protein